MRGQEFGTPFAVTANHATSAVATKSAVTGSTHYITDISGSSDKAGAKILVKDGTTVIWQDRISSTAAYTKTFLPALKVTVSADASVTVDGTAECNANIAGYTL